MGRVIPPANVFDFKRLTCGHCGWQFMALLALLAYNNEYLQTFFIYFILFISYQKVREFVVPSAKFQVAIHITIILI